MTPCDGCSREPDAGSAPNTVVMTRREWVRSTGAGVSGVMLAGLARAQGAPSPATADAPYPELRIAQVSALQPDVPLAFTYPDAASPAIAVRLRAPAAGGVGPGQSIVAFSLLCTHKGCPVAYRPERKLLICPCHWSTFDPAKGGQMVIGQASQALPQIKLRVDGSSLVAYGVDGLIFGRHTNML
jgi:arsenite oxidase small subunit